VKLGGGEPLFATLLNYRHSLDHANAEWAKAEGIGVLEGQDRTNYPITFCVDDLGEGFSMTAQTAVDIDPRVIVEYMKTALHSLVDDLTRNANSAALSLSVMPPEERHKVINLFNAKRAQYPQDTLIHELFEQQVRAAPDSVAVVFESESLTYRELNRRANQLANYLRWKGINLMIWPQFALSAVWTWWSGYWEY